MIQTVIFDLGGVLIDWNPRYLYDKIFSTKSEVDYFLENITTFDWNEKQDAGRLLQEATSILLERYPQEKWREPIEAFYGRWSEMLSGSIAGTVDILRECKDNPDLSIFALTNWSAETWPIAVERFEFLNWFEGTLVSGEEGMKKPANEFYLRLLDKFSIDKDTAIFIDDNQRNVDASNALGLKAILFNDPEQLRKDLLELGLLA